MASQSWYPILPDLKDNGSFLALAADKNADELKPVALEATDITFAEFSVKQQNYSIELAAKLGITSFSGGVTFKGFCLTYEAMLYSDKIVSTPIGGKIYGTRWGAGLRVVLKVTDIQANANFNFGAIAASTELGLANVEYEITGLGISDPGILAELPDPGQFNFANYQKILDASAKVKAYMAANKQNLKPMPYQVLLSDDIQTDLLSDSRSVLFAVRSFADRNNLNDTLQKAGVKYSPDIIKAVYAQWGIINNTDQPTRTQKQQAEDWLDV